MKSPAGIRTSSGTPGANTRMLNGPRRASRPGPTMSGSSSVTTGDGAPLVAAAVLDRYRVAGLEPGRKLDQPKARQRLPRVPVLSRAAASTDLPSSLVMTSPDRIPALAAGPLGVTAST